MPKACEDYFWEDCFYSNEVTLDRGEMYYELLRTKTVFGTLHGWLVLKLEGTFSKPEGRVFQIGRFIQICLLLLCVRR